MPTLALESRLCELITESPISEQARYALLSGGKRLRPKIVLVTSSLYDVKMDVALDPACAIEMVHTYSLIHDDLPCMDDDDFRRGKPSLHKAFSEAEAVLAGDYLLTYAFEILAYCPNAALLIRTLAQRAGAHGMVGGQVLDIQGKESALFKTAALFSASFEFGGILGDAPQSDLEVLSKIGESFGMAFQLADDIADGEGGSQERVEDFLEYARKQLFLLSVDGAPLLPFIEGLHATL